MKSYPEKNRASVKIIEKFNIVFLSDEFTKFLYQQRLRQRIRENNILNTDDAENVWSKLQSNLIEKIVDKRKINQNERPHKTLVYLGIKIPSRGNREKKIVSPI
jgi:hypothetical protein